MIFEAVPNVSIAGKQELLPVLANSITESFNQDNPGKLLNVHFDSDHNRAVFTYIGTRQAISQASLNLIATALENIDLSQHQGIHPFRGVVDILPIIAIKQDEQRQAIEIATEIGQKAGKLFDLPVFYYEKNAVNKELTSLPSVRNYLTENKETLKTNPRKGVLIIGARDFLVAYNVNLHSTDLDLAKKIARQIREPNSGLVGVRALGLFLKSKSQVQVSCNLTKPFQVSTQIVYNEVKSLLKALGKADIVAEPELVGCLPQEVIKQAQELEKING